MANRTNILEDIKGAVRVVFILVFVVATLASYYSQVDVAAKTVPWMPSGLSKISAGASHSCAIATGAAYCWGMGQYGRLGNGATTNALIPTAVSTSGVLAGKTVTAISAGLLHTCAIASGAAYCWGYNASGQLGDNSTVESSVPVAVSGALAGKTVTAISAGDTTTCAVADSLAYCWGANNYGQLGTNSTTPSLVPVAVSVKSSGNPRSSIAGMAVTDINTGVSHACAIANNTAHCWGRNDSGQLGDNSTTQALLPVAVNATGVLSGKSVTKLEASGDHTCAVASGAAYCWGSGASYRLGTNSTSGSLVPIAVSVSAPSAIEGKTIASISAGASYSCAVDTAGAAYCWGANFNGQLGDNTTTTQSVPVAVNTSGLLAGKTITELSAGTNHTCAITSQSAYCWGFNFYGQLGDNSTSQSLVAVVVSTVYMMASSPYRFFNNVDSVQPGSSLASTGAKATLPNAGSEFRVRTGVKGGVSDHLATDVATGADHTCALSNGAIYCWGLNDNGELGNNSTSQSLVPVATDDSGVLSSKVITSISAGQDHTCAVASGAAYCWGNNGSRLGNNSPDQSNVPVAVDTSGVLAGKTVTAISAGQDHTCAVASGAAYCWGASYQGHLGYNSLSTSSVPVAVDTSGVLAGKTVTAISVGNAHTCAVASGAAYCWGRNTNGQLGNNSTSQANVPVAVDTSGVLAGKTVTAINAGTASSCAIAATLAYCWGWNDSGRLGDSTTVQRLIPVAVTTGGGLSGKTLSMIDTHQHTCTATAGLVYCWGVNASGQLGDGTTGFKVSPNEVKKDLISVSAVANQLPVGNPDYSLHYAARTAGSCRLQTSGFAAVTTTSAIAWKTNPSVSNGAAITANAGDPTVAGDTAYQSYVSGGTAFTTTSAIPAGKYGLWDFSLKDNSGLSGASYCLKIVLSDGTSLDQYNEYPEIVTASVGTSLEYVDATGAPVLNPIFAMQQQYFSSACQTTTGAMGGATGDRLRITQGGGPGSGWSVSIAPLNGSVGLWSRSDAGAFYDFNDPSGTPAGCNSGSDGDGYGGQLTFGLGSTVIEPQAGCSTTGLSTGNTNASFVDSVVDAITLTTASSSAQASCYWDVYGTAVSQTIPANQSQGDYDIILTATVVAQ